MATNVHLIVWRGGTEICWATMTRLPSARASAQESSATRAVDGAVLVAWTMMVTEMSQGAAGFGGEDERGDTVT